MSLNELTPELEKIICPTDSRLRPDIRKLENGDQDGAAAEKSRLEEKQRETRKARKHKKGQEWTPRYIESLKSIRYILQHIILLMIILTTSTNIEVYGMQIFRAPQVVPISH